MYFDEQFEWIIEIFYIVMTTPDQSLVILAIALLTSSLNTVHFSSHQLSKSWTSISNNEIRPWKISLYIYKLVQVKMT